MSNEEIKQLESVATDRKPKRVKSFKEDYVRDLTIARMELHAVKCANEKLQAEIEAVKQSHRNTLDCFNNLENIITVAQAVRLLVKAVVRKVRGV